MSNRMTEAEEKLADIIWSREPVLSRDLVNICEEAFGWKKSTTYTMLKRLESKNIFKNDCGSVISTIKKEDYLAQQGCSFIDTEFNGSLPAFISAFTKKRKLTKDDIQSLRKMIEDFEEE